MVAGAQQTGTITGRVTDAASGAPVASALLQIVGTTPARSPTRPGATPSVGCPARQVTVRVLRVGYSELTRVVTVAAGAPATVDLVIRQRRQPDARGHHGHRRAASRRDRQRHLVHRRRKVAETAPVASSTTCSTRAPPA
jgi:hypothetical protein